MVAFIGLHIVMDTAHVVSALLWLYGQCGGIIKIMPIVIVNNPFQKDKPAWQDEYGRVGIRVGTENTVHWYDSIVDNNKNSSILDEVTMIVDEPFHNIEEPCRYLIGL